MLEALVYFVLAVLVMPCYSPLVGTVDEVTGGITFRPESTGNPMEVACGQCLGCRLDRSRHWAVRMVHESELYANGNGNSFITLTYRDKVKATRSELAKGYYIRDDWSLDSPILYPKSSGKSHFQKFMKRLRKFCPEDKIRFFMCGEYGAKCKHGIELDKVKCPMCNVGRPHYHAILFNVSFPDKYAYGVQNGVTRYTSPSLQKLWPYGFVDVGDVTVQSAGYVARYCLKKVTGDVADEHYSSVDIHGEITNVAPEYATMSNGIGSAWYEKFKSDVFPSDEVPVTGKAPMRGVPRYYMEKLREEDEEMFDDVKFSRFEYKMDNAEEFSPERLMSKYKVKKAQVNLLKRTI